MLRGSPLCRDDSVSFVGLDYAIGCGFTGSVQGDLVGCLQCERTML